jgi:glycosyltransferase involved in cell wall biosynthesis
MAEVYPEMYKSSQKYGNRSLIERVIKNPKIAEKYEQAILPKVDHTLVMIEESRERLLRLGVPKEKITIVSNTPETKNHNKSQKHSGNQLRIVYVGFLTELRGLDILIKSVAQFLSRGNFPESIKVDIVGKGSFKEELVKLINTLGVSQSITMHGWLSQPEVNSLMEKANVGALTYRVCGHWNHTIPNKIFDYMLGGLPVLATNVIPIQRIIQETGCGIICKDQDPQDIADKLELLRDPALRQQLGDRGQESVLKKFNWNTDKKRLLEALARQL